MRTLCFVFFTLITLNCFSQAREEPVKSKAPKTTWLSNTPGTELRKASTDYFICLGGLVSGGILFGIGSTEQAAVNPTGNSNNTTGLGAIEIGTIALGTGLTYGVLAWVHIMRAGRLMDAYKVSFGPTRNGIGLAYNF
jgi:hypothetical protein